MKKIFLASLMILMLSGCGGEAQNQTPPPTSNADKKILVVYFSRTGEEYNVGTISKGNTAIVAEFIAQRTRADVFEVKPATPYPDEYEACTELSKRELETNARPPLANTLPNLEQYDTIFIGYPIWWGALPRIMMTFVESGSFGGKKLIPFCTHGGSGLASTERELAEACPKAEILSGLAIVGKRCQNDSAGVQRDVNEWLQGLGY